MTFDVDRYYTPRDVAIKVLEKSSFSKSPIVCADSACGSGRLLEAADDVYGSTHCIGFDRDRKAIFDLRRRKPDWLLSVGDLLNPASYRASQVGRRVIDADVLLLNPPFSQGDKKYREASYQGQTVRCSLAMNYILCSLELFHPTDGAIAIVPESLLYSELDATARDILEQRYSIANLGSLKSTTFSGTRARAIAVQLAPSSKKTQRPSPSCKKDAPKAELVRGALSVHLMRPNSKGTAFIHTTDLQNLASNGKHLLRRTGTIAKGRVSGWALLLPRVGLPLSGSTRPVHFRQTVQLSDCVIAAKFQTKAEASSAAKRLKDDLHSIQDLYRGTGARYTTMKRLVDGLLRIGICATIVAR